MVNDSVTHNLFSGIIGESYHMLKLICPLATEMSRLVGQAVAKYPHSSESLRVVELGTGTGITSLALLSAGVPIRLFTIDSAMTMVAQARTNLKNWAQQGLIEFCESDALTALAQLSDASVDILASAYTIHNFERDYRGQVIQEIYRILKPGGQFINGDRYALDDLAAHTALIQQEISGYFKVLTEVQRLDLLEQWIVHLFNDESEHHVMRESYALNELAETGFKDIKLSDRMEVNALVTAVK